MNTVMIWETFEEPIRFAIIDGDKSHLHLVYLNSSPPKGKKKKEHEALQYELNDLFWDADGNKKITLLDTFPVEEVRNGSNVIVCGFIP